MKLRFVVEEPRDEAVLPALVDRLLNRRIEATARYFWSINAPSVRKAASPRRGFASKLSFAIRQAKDEGLHGVIAVLDRDDSPRGARRKQLDDGRGTEPLLPTALGIADPHLEAWLLDDPKAVREVLGLHSNLPIPAPTKCSPKEILNQLWERSASRETTQSAINALARIADNIVPLRCTHSKDTGFAEFQDEVVQYFGADQLRSA